MYEWHTLSWGIFAIYVISKWLAVSLRFPFKSVPGVLPSSVTYFIGISQLWHANLRQGWHGDPFKAGCRLVAMSAARSDEDPEAKRKKQELYVPPDSLNGDTPENKAAKSLTTLITYVSVRSEHP